MTDDKKKPYVDKYKNEKDGDDYYIIPERGSEGSYTGKQLIYRRGEFGERWRLLKASAESQDEKKHYAEYELRDIKKDQVMYDKKLGAFVDGKGNKYSGKDINKQNNIVRARMNLVIKEMGIEDKNYINKWMFAKNRNLNNDDEDLGEQDWAHESLKTDEEIAQEKRKKFKHTTVAPAPRPTETKVEEKIIFDETPRPPEPSVEEIINYRAKMRNLQSGIGGLNPNRSTGLNYLTGHDDEIT